MFGLLFLINITSLIAFGVGLINPKLVLSGEKRTRRKSSEVYLSAFVFIEMVMGQPATHSFLEVAVAHTPIQSAAVEKDSTSKLLFRLTMRLFRLTMRLF